MPSISRLFAHMRTRADACDAHRAPVPPDRFAVDSWSFQWSLSRHLSRPIKRPWGVDLINAMFEPDFGGFRRVWLRGHSRPLRAYEFHLDAHGEFLFFTETWQAFYHNGFPSDTMPSVV